MKRINMKKHPPSTFQHPPSKDVNARPWLFDVGCWRLDVSIFRLGCGLLALWASATFAFAQSNGVPGPSDYAKFSAFVTDRNIFDPNRVPHNISSGNRPRTRTRVRNSAPGIMLVGTMSYEKGLFAFFNGNSADLKKALQAGDKIADYTVTDIAPSRVTLESADKKQQLKLKVGDGLRQENGKWVLSNSGELPAETGSAETANATDADSSTPAAPVAAGEQNDVLKRLMQLRAKENQ